MKNYEFKIPEENSTNIFTKISFSDSYEKSKINNVFEEFKLLGNIKINKIVDTPIIGNMMLGNTNRWNPLDRNVSVFSNFNNSNDETQRQFIAANKVLKPIKIDEKALREMEEFNLLD